MMKKQKIYTTAVFVILTVWAYFLADTLDAVIGENIHAAPLPISSPTANPSFLPSVRELSSYASILDRGLFGDGAKPSVATPVASSVTYKLIGTAEGGVFTGAVLDDGKGQMFCRLNQKLPDGSTLIEVVRNKVTLRGPDGRTSTVENADDPKIVVVQHAGSETVKKLTNGTYLVDQREVLASMQNMNQLLTQARALPYMEQGKQAGFRIAEITPGSLYQKIGLQNGDIIQAVNSQSLDDPAKFFQLYQGLRNVRNISIDVVRNGQRQTLNYDIR